MSLCLRSLDRLSPTVGFSHIAMRSFRHVGGGWLYLRACVYDHIMLLSVRVIATRPFRRSAMIQDLPVPCLPPAKCSHPYRGRRGWTRDMSERTTRTSAGRAAPLPSTTTPINGRLRNGIKGLINIAFHGIELSPLKRSSLFSACRMWNDNACNIYVVNVLSWTLLLIMSRNYFFILYYFVFFVIIVDIPWWKSSYG